MTHDTPQGWEPDPQKMGNWRAMFDQQRSGKPPDAPPATARSEPTREQVSDEDISAPDLSVYKPWTLQRGRSRPALMLELRTYEARSGLWSGIQLSYPTLLAVEYTGDRLLSLDFGTRHYVIEGRGLDELARHLQQGSVVSVQEFAPRVWTALSSGPMVAAIRQARTQSGIDG